LKSLQGLRQGASDAVAATRARQLRRTGFVLAGVGLGMLGMAYVAVPLYRVFCQATGYNGTTQRAVAAPQQALAETIAVRFDSNVAPGLDWQFQPVQRQMRLNIGEEGLAFFEASNSSDHDITGTATFNVTPEIAGSYFNKIQCFCFTEQTLKPGERVQMPVSFFVDPAIRNDPDARGVEEITLSYTFFRAADGGKSAGATAAAARGRPQG
jgi:cytochrome c oxidase assembly protein subunit 11